VNRKLIAMATAFGASLAVIAAVAPAAQAESSGRGLWTFSETGSPKVAFDSSGNGNNGANSNVVGNGSGYVFNGHSSKVVVPNSASLNPGSSDFSFSVTFISQLPPKGGDYDMIRKGDGPGEYKIEVVNSGGAAKAFCLAKDVTRKSASISGTTNLADGQQHTITCTKTANGITLQVDNLKPRVKTVSGTLGAMTNKNSLVIGTKKVSGGDWFQGTMLEASVS
jgi:Concanavalin A-like lectin/glucanases superfamily